MGYRSDFEILTRGIFESINVKRIDHDAKATKGNKPDFIVLKNDIPILYIEAKDIGTSLDKVEKSEQMARYYGYANLVLTDYLEFRFYRNGIKYQEPIKIGTYDIKGRNITSVPGHYEYLAKTLVEFTQSQREPIKSGKHLAKIMGGKAQRIRDNVKQIFESENKDRDIFNVYETIKKLLVHDLSTDSFADMYAQTLVYGLFVARYYDDPATFSRQTARDLIPASNPFLRHFFDHIAGLNFESRLRYIVDELCEVFKHANTKELMGEYFKEDAYIKEKGGSDPVIHFYEDFLNEYDSGLRKKMGAYYTPLPVVKFIVRAVDQILEHDFGLPRGLADTSKTPADLHRVQILDPAVGTGTFISAVIDKIYERILKIGQKGSWGSYVHNELLPRLYGFELMMAPYTIAHLKLSMALKETGFKYFNETREGKARLGIYLTNSLEDIGQQPELLAFDFAASIAEEAKEASKIKNEKPIMVVIGNPPYSVSSSNKGAWITELIKVYKTGLSERNIQPLSDDYIKFIRFAEHFIEKNGEGIVAMITNNSFLDGVTHRQMRKHLLETFDNIYVVNLSARNQPEDQNVFDIVQGVSINIFVKNKPKIKSLGNVYYAEVIAKRDVKFIKLNNGDIKYKKLKFESPYYFFVPKDLSQSSEYYQGLNISELFVENNAGTATGKDELFVDYVRESLIKKLNSSGISFNEDNIQKYNYRIFDVRYFVYDNKLIQRLRDKIMKHLKPTGQNISLVTTKLLSSSSYQHCFVSNIVGDRCLISNKGKEANYYMPLYLYTNGNKLSNLKKEIVDNIAKIVGARSPEEIFDYVYATLHSPSYREKYKEFLKIDFPRVPYPKDKKQFEAFVVLGRELRGIHLLESPKVSKFITTYPVSGSDEVEKISHKDNKVFINKDQYFGNVPELAWNFYIGGYQPAQKWLKDRKGRTLNNEDIEHYQKIIVALTETDRIMKEIDKIYRP